MTGPGALPALDVAARGGRRWGRRCWSQGARILWLHGLFGSAEAWAPVLERAPELGGQAWELPGHGHSQAWSQAEGGLQEAAAALAVALMEAEGPQPWCVVGYSLGARMAMHLALVAPGLVGALCLLAGDPGLEVEAKAERWRQDQAWATRLNEEGWEAFAKAWEALPLFAGLGRLTPSERERWRAMRGGGVGGTRPLGEAMLAFSPARQASLWPELPRIQAPTWWVAGAEDAKYAALVPRAAAHQGPQAQAQLLPGLTHALPIEGPAAVAAIVRQALGSVSIGRQPHRLAAGGSA